jgi:hypothetical protein
VCEKGGNKKETVQKVCDKKKEKSSKVCDKKKEKKFKGIRQHKIYQIRISNCIRYKKFQLYLTI